MDWIRALRKGSLHVHLEGSAEPETLRELDPSLEPDEIARRYQYADFRGFLQAYVWANKLMRTPEDYATVARRLLERLQSEGVVYAEITLSAGMALWKDQPFGPIYDAVQREAARSPIRTFWIIDAVRQFGVEHVQRVADMAIERAGEGAIALGIGGDEAGGPAVWFRDIYARCRDAGLHLHAHAGETTGPESVWQALEIGCERIGHGLRAVEDPELLAELARRRITLEICPTSNLRTGSVPSLDAHPLRRIYDAGVPIALDTDDPAIFGCTLSGEYELAMRQFGFTREEIEGLAANSLAAGFSA